MGATGRRGFAVESESLKAYRKALEMRGCITEKVHGSLFQSGLPDLLVADSAGGITLIECKRVTASSRLDYVGVQGLLDADGSRQRALFVRLGLRGASVAVQVYAADRGRVDDAAACAWALCWGIDVARADATSPRPVRWATLAAVVTATLDGSDVV